MYTFSLFCKLAKSYKVIIILNECCFAVKYNFKMIYILYVHKNSFLCKYRAIY